MEIEIKLKFVWTLRTITNTNRSNSVVEITQKELLLEMSNNQSFQFLRLSILFLR